MDRWMHVLLDSYFLRIKLAVLLGKRNHGFNAKWKLTFFAM